jgi:hypothetical protein
MSDTQNEDLTGLVRELLAKQDQSIKRQQDRVKTDAKLRAEHEKRLDGLDEWRQVVQGELEKLKAIPAPLPAQPKTPADAVVALIDALKTHPWILLLAMLLCTALACGTWLIDRNPDVLFPSQKEQKDD